MATFKKLYEYHNNLNLSKNKKNLTYPERIKTDILVSLVLVIGENGTILKTPLMERANMNSKRLKLYLNWLELTEFVKIYEQDMVLTESGRRFLGKIR